MSALSEKLYRAAQIREMEDLAFSALGITAQDLMLRAGQAVFAELRRRWPNKRRLAVFCGAGNNGGDGYVTASLALQADYAVRVYALGAPDSLQGAALQAYQAYQQAGGLVSTLEEDTSLPGVDIIVDALLGTGLNRQPNANYAAAIELINAADCPIVAADIPSGLQADSGNAQGSAVKAAATVSFVGLKAGLFTGMAADYCGEIVFADLDLPAELFAQIQPAAGLLKKTALPARSRTAHKGRFGHVLLIGGNHGYFGAIRLAAEAALRCGAGLVSVATRAGHAPYLAIGRPEIMSHGVESIAELQVMLNKASVIAIGPGLGQDDWAQAMFAQAIDAGKPMLMDADALNLLATQPRYRPNWVMTPHPGEAARLLGSTIADIAADRYQAVTALQQRYGGVCVLKGAGSLVCDDQGIYVNTTGNPGMAGGGMGDVLSGIVAALLAQGLPPAAAAGLADFVHGQAADLCAAEHGERGLLASDLFAELRRCLQSESGAAI